MNSIVVIGLLTALSPAQGPLDVRSLEKSIQQSVQKADAAVASVLISRRDPPIPWQQLIAPEAVPEYFGNGVVIDDRLILTCFHLVRDAKVIAVRLPGLIGKNGQPLPERVSAAQIYAADARSDLAVLKLLDQSIDTPNIELGRGEELKKGQFVVGLGHPFAAGFQETGPSAALGIIGNTRQRSPGSPREWERNKNRQWCGTLVQTDSRLGFGLSGTALISLDGKLAALSTTQAALPQGNEMGGYAIPIDVGMRRVIEKLRKGEEVDYGFLGITSQERWDRRSQDQMAGAYISSVSRNGPAERAGIQSGDRIVAVNGQTVRNFDDIYVHVGFGLAGHDSTIDVVRGFNERLKFRVNLAKAYNREFGIATNQPAPVHGLTVDYTSVYAQFNQDTRMPDGVVVREVESGSPAASAELKPYQQIIKAVNDVPVRTPAEFYREAAKATGRNQSVRLTVVTPEPVPERGFRRFPSQPSADPSELKRSTITLP